MDTEAQKIKYERMAENSKRHHWVPRFYLSYFSHPVASGQVYMYQPSLKAQLANVVNLAVGKELYTFKQVDGQRTKAIEGIFSEHESEVKEILDNVIESETLPTNEKDLVHIATFVAMLKTRGPSMTDWLKNMHIEQEKLVTQLRAKDPKRLAEDFTRAGITFSSQEEFEEMRKFMADPSRYTINMRGGEEYYFKQAMELGWKMYEIFMTEKSWHLLVAPRNRSLITSDNPVVIQEIEECPWHLASGVLNGTILLSLSPRLCLALRRIPLDRKKIFLSEQDIDHINRSIAMAARKQVYSNVNSKRLQRLCDKYLSGKSTAVSVKRMAQFAPYYLTQNAPQQKEAQGIKKHSRPIH